MIKIISRIIVFYAFLTNNKNGKQYDVFGRSYRETYKYFGNKEMADEYLNSNSWHVKWLNSK